MNDLHNDNRKNVVRNSINGTDPYFGFRCSVSPYSTVPHKSENTKKNTEVHASVSNILLTWLRNNQTLLPDSIWLGRLGDPYPRIEKEHRLNRRILEFLAQFQCGLLITTSNLLVLRDIDILQEIHNTALATVAVPIMGLGEKNVRVDNRGESSNRNRFLLLERLKRTGIQTGILLTNVLPDNNASEKRLKRLFTWSRENGIDFIQVAPRYVKKFNSKNYSHIRELLREHWIEYHINPIVKRYLPQDFRRENYWLSGQLVSRTFLKELSSEQIKAYLNTASAVATLSYDIRRHVKNSDLETADWIAPLAKDEVVGLLSGTWAYDSFTPDRFKHNTDTPTAIRKGEYNHNLKE